ncbi:hypothetical protein F5B20DRAFT_538948 [Whalleya microplaca]|nr:hypothetical protein F5B20DRAFT_538948 [Whalleya microplaca]
MYGKFSLLVTIVLSVAAATQIRQATNTTRLPSPSDITGIMTIYTPRVTAPSFEEPKKELSICCCCVAAFDTQPEPDHYMVECPREGVRDVCGEEPVGESSYHLGGLENHPEEVASVCSRARCGAVEFVD